MSGDNVTNQRDRVTFDKAVKYRAFSYSFGQASVFKKSMAALQLSKRSTIELLFLSFPSPTNYESIRGRNLSECRDTHFVSLDKIYHPTLSLLICFLQPPFHKRRKPTGQIEVQRVTNPSSIRSKASPCRSAGQTHFGL
jgi:hypothetical protein